jgi:hypothetical protein
MIFNSGPPPNESLSGFGFRQKIFNPKLFHRECAQWRALVNMVTNLWVSPNTGTFLSILAKQLLASQGGLRFMQLACYLSSPAHTETVCSKLEQTDKA